MVEPGDTLITTCTYDNRARDNATSFGPSSFDEMCFNFLQYWPALPNMNYAVTDAKMNVTVCEDVRRAGQLFSLVPDKTGEGVQGGRVNQTAFDQWVKEGKVVPGSAEQQLAALGPYVRYDGAGGNCTDVQAAFGGTAV